MTSMPGMLAVTGSAGGAFTISPASAAGLATALRASKILFSPAFSALANSCSATLNTRPRTNWAAYSNAFAISGAPEAREMMRISFS